MSKDTRGSIIRLLIVDDENLTRSGLASSIDWPKLGINEVDLAEDGLDGLQKARRHEPEIVLSDVRMPKMDGIEMMNRIHTLYPDTVFIFMSGFSDKDYLMAAIKLHAVRYVEKPLNSSEVKYAVSEAAEFVLTVQKQHEAELLNNTISASNLALALTAPYSLHRQSIEELAEEYCRRYGSATLFHSAASIILSIDIRSELPPDFLFKINNTLHDRIRAVHLHMISAEKKTNMFIFHIFRKQEFSGQSVSAATDIIRSLIPAGLLYFIAAGNIVSGIQNLNVSYNNAVLSLERCFFHEPGTCLFSSDSEYENPSNNTGVPEDLFTSLKQAIHDNSYDDIQDLSGKLYEAVFESNNLVRSMILNRYYQLQGAILEQKRINQLPDDSPDVSTLSSFENCFSYPEMHKVLIAEINDWKTQMDSKEPDSSSVNLIKTYIRKHYTNPMLSTKDISDYARLSASYACTLFKDETGQTLNQFITDYRINRAKELLDDPRNNISKIAAKVGYNDGNYFSKAFKKITGSSPSEYREGKKK